MPNENEYKPEAWVDPAGLFHQNTGVGDYAIFAKVRCIGIYPNHKPFYAARSIFRQRRPNDPGAFYPEVDTFEWALSAEKREVIRKFTFYEDSLTGDKVSSKHLEKWDFNDVFTKEVLGKNTHKLSQYADEIAKVRRDIRQINKHRAYRGGGGDEPPALVLKWSDDGPNPMDFFIPKGTTAPFVYSAIKHSTWGHLWVLADAAAAAEGLGLIFSPFGIAIRLFKIFKLLKEIYFKSLFYFNILDANIITYLYWYSLLKFMFLGIIFPIVLPLIIFFLFIIKRILKINSKKIVENSP